MRRWAKNLCRTVVNLKEDIRLIDNRMLKRFKEIEDDFANSGCKQKPNDWFSVQATRNLGKEIDLINSRLNRLFDYLKIEEQTTPQPTIVKKKHKK